MKKVKGAAKIISILLCMMMVFSLFPVTALADTAGEGDGGEGGGTPLVTETPTDPPDDDGLTPPEDPPLDEELPPEGVLPPQGEGEGEGGGESTPTEHTVRFLAGDVEFAVETVKDGTPVTEPSDQPDAPEGMEFAYWYSTSSDTPYNFSDLVYSSFVLTAKFVEATTGGDFTTDGMLGVTAFSVGIGGIEEPSTFWVYHFVVNGVETGTQTLKSGESLTEPAAPTPDAGQRFVGWFEGEAQFTAFGPQTFAVAGETTLTAHFATAYYAFFHNKDNAVIETRAPGADNLVSTANVSNLILGAEEKLIGWSTTSGGTTDVGATVEVKNGNVDLYPIVQSVIWITFETGGGTYVPPMAIGKGDWLTDDDVADYIRSQTGSFPITRDGYKFEHWLAHGQYFWFGKIYDNMTLTAVWSEKTVSYTVVYWKENAAADGTYYADSSDTTRKADAGDTVSATSSDRTKFTGYPFNYDLSTPVTVAADGSTQLNLYYDRMLCTIDFQVPGVNGDHYLGNYNSLTKSTGYTGTPVINWPSTTDLTILDGYVFIGWYTDRNHGSEVRRLERFENSGSAVFDGNGKMTLYARFQEVENNYYTYTVDYYLQTAPGDVYSNTPVASRSYTYKSNKTEDYRFSELYSGYSVAAYSINAVPGKIGTNAGSTVTINPYRGTRIQLLNVYYRWNNYSLSVYNGTIRIGYTQLPYLSALTPYQPANPEKPIGVSASAVWSGWYTTQNGLSGSEMNWNGTMPAGNLSVYGVWKEPVFTATAHLTPYGTSGGTRSLGSITYGGEVNTSALSSAEAAARLNPPHAGDTFVGWLQLNNGSLTAFNPNAPVYGNLDLYPNWTSSVRYTVTYALNGVVGTAPTDFNRYAPGSQAQVLGLGSGVTVPSGKVFIGWKSSLDNKVYYPGGSVIVSNNLTLTAQWGDEAPRVRLTYYGNGGLLKDGVTGSYSGAWVANNNYYNLEGNSFERENYTFSGWNTSADGSGTSYQPGDPVLLGMSGTFSGLYAQWDADTFDVTLAFTPDGSATTTFVDGSFELGEDVTLAWTPASGYVTTKVEDNKTEVATSGNSYTISDIDADHDVFVTLEQKTYALIYVAQNGTTDESREDVIWDAPYTIASNSFSYAGHYFLGWTSISGGTTPEPAYAPGTNFEHMPNHDVKLYAAWGTRTALTITSIGDTVGYDGNVHSVTGFTSTESGLKFEGISASASGKMPGEYTAAFTGQDDLVIKRTSDLAIVTDQYDVTYAEGKLTINPEVTYVDSINGAEYASEFVAYGTGDASYSVRPPLNATDRDGKVYYWDGTYDISAGDPASTDVKVNLTITAHYTPVKTLTITAKSLTVDYTGSKQTVTEAEPFATGLKVTGYEVYGEGTDAGTYDVKVTLNNVVIRNSADEDITYQYTVVPVKGKLTILPIDMPVLVSGYTGLYDGKDHRITVTPSVTTGTKIAYSLSAHNSPAGYTMTSNPASRNVSDSRTVYFVVTNPNYNPYYGSADITISPVPIEVKAQDKSWMYDGNEHSWHYYTITSGAFVDRQGFASVSFDPASEVKNVGPAVANTITGYRLMSGTRAENYTITTLAGSLSITPSNRLRVWAIPTVVVYDGNEHSIGARASDMSGTELYYSLTGGTDLANYTKDEYKGVDVADSATVYVAAVNPNYITAFSNAGLTITKRGIYLLSDTDAKVYDGTPLMAPKVWQLGDFVHDEGFVTTPVATSSLTNAGIIANQFVVPELKENTDPNNYRITYDFGRLIVSRRYIMLVADDATKNFGDPDPTYTYHTYTGRSMGWSFYDIVASDLAGAAVNIVRTDLGQPTGEDPGVHSNVLSVQLGDGSTILSGNYVFFTRLGTLTINPQISYLTGTTDTVTGMPANQWTPYNTSATLSSGATAVRFGYALTGWLDVASGTNYALGGTTPVLLKNLELTAQWTPNLNTVSFLTGTGAAVANMPANIAAAAYLSNVTLPAVVPTRVGFTFDGWASSDVDGVARVYAADATFVMPNQGVTFTATWAPNLSAVTYVANYGGGGSFVEGMHATLSTVTVAGNRFNRLGYRFLGWSDTAAGAVSRQPGSTFIMPATAITFYAQWERLEYAVNYYVTGGTGTGLDGASPYATYTGLHYGDAMPVPDDPTLDGYSFGGWTGLPATVPVGGLTVYGAMTALQAPAAPLTERIDENATPLAGKSGVPLWIILAGAGLLGLGLLWFFLILLKRRKEEEENQQGAI